MARNRQLAALHTRRPSMLVKPQVIKTWASHALSRVIRCMHSSTQVSGMCVWSVPSVSIGGKQRPPGGQGA